MSRPSIEEIRVALSYVEHIHARPRDWEILSATIDELAALRALLAVADKLAAKWLRPRGLLSSSPRAIAQRECGAELRRVLGESDKRPRLQCDGEKMVDYGWAKVRDCQGCSVCERPAGEVGE